MRKIAVWSMLLASVLLAGAALAADNPHAGKATAQTVTLEGQVLCARCTLHEKDQKDCQNVLVVEQGGNRTSYYLVKNEAYAKLGDVCEASKRVSATGTVETKDGQQWLAASEIKVAAPKS